MTKLKDLLIEGQGKMKDQILKDLSKDVVISGHVSHGKDDKGLTPDDRAARKAYFTALASGNDAEIQRSNDIQVKQYEDKGIEWRDDAEMKTKAQTVGTSTQGGVLVPVTLRNSIIERLYYISPMRQLATTINDMPAALDMPYDTALPTTYWVGEGVAITESGATFNKKQLVPYKLAGFDSFTSESLADTAVNPDLQEVVIQRYATAIGLAENAAFVSGTGSSQPFGFRSSDITPTTIATNTTAGNLAYSDLVAQMFTLPTAYRMMGVWVTSSTGLQLIDNIKDTAGRPVFLPSRDGLANVDATGVGSVLGRPLYVVDEIPNNLGAGTNETQLWFAVFKNYFIGNRGAMRTDYGTNGTDFAQDKISLRMIERVAGRPFLDVAWTVKNIK